MDPAAPAARTPGPAAKDGGRPTRPVRAAPGANEGREGIIGLLNLGQNLSERSDWDTAEITYRQVMASPNANTNDLADALIGLARVYRRQGSLTKAAAVYERFLNDYPDSQHRPDAYLELGRTHRALGAYQMALARFYSVINSTLKLSSEGFGHYQLLAKTAQFEIAETHFQQGNFAEANKFFSRLRLLDLSPADRAHAHFKSAYALYLGADMEGAVTTLNAYLGQWPEDENVAEARYLLSLSLGALGRKQEALDATLQLLSTQQATGDAKRWSYWQRKTGNQLANDFFQNGDTNNALVIYLGLVALSADPSWQLPITYQVGLCYERMRLTDRAIAAYQGIVDHAAPPATATSPSGQTGGPNPKLSPEQGKPVSSDLMELARMAAWRIGQLNWHDQTERQLAGIFIATPQPTKPAPLPVKASPVSSESAVPRLNL
ncbi:MAG: tetratricopeptide repeat protein [Opitutae bacterium]